MLMEKLKHKKNMKVFLIIAIIICFLFLILAISASIIYNKYDLDINKLTNLNNGVKVYSSSGIDNTLYNTNRSIVEIENLPKYVTEAFIDIEDKRFYSHNGYDLKRIIKASLVNFMNQSKSQGASTISQQLIKNALLSNEKTFSRKIQEIVLSIKMEKKFSKDEILEMYLNTIYFGSNAYGIENASKVYFNKCAKDLTINEACCLAGIIKSPLRYSPKLNYNNSLKRKNFVAKTMYQAGSISKDEYDEVLASPIKLSTYNELDHSYEEEAIFEACRLLNINERELINNGYQIVTFKDDDLQKEVIKINNSQIKICEEETNSNLDSLSIVVDNSGKVLSYFANSNYSLHNLRRQPASTLKPISVYLPCIIHNILTPATYILDEEIDYNGFSPKNADKTFHEYVTTRYALSHSLNIPSVKALEYLGLNKSKECLADFGIVLDKSDLNLNLALGSMKNGVYISDLLSAYITLANLGQYHELSFVDKILDKNGNVVYKHTEYSENIFDEGDCFLINNILKDSATSGTSKRLSSLNLPVASKTGTAYNGENNTDLYNIAYTSEHTLLTWIADLHHNYLPNNLLSSVVPTEINKNILKYIYSDIKPTDFKQPKNIEYLPYDILEAKENHRIVSPSSSLDRYIAYDYFKTNNKPIEIKINNNLDLTVELDKMGATASFTAKKNKEYKLYKKIENTSELIATINEQSGKIKIIDNNIFKFNEITYYLVDEQSNKSDEIIIKPKEYLMNLLNNEITQNKRKWYVRSSFNH